MCSIWNICRKCYFKNINWNSSHHTKIIQSYTPKLLSRHSFFFINDIFEYVESKSSAWFLRIFTQKTLVMSAFFSGKTTRISCFLWIYVLAYIFRSFGFLGSPFNKMKNATAILRYIPNWPAAVSGRLDRGRGVMRHSIIFLTFYRVYLTFMVPSWTGVV